MKAKITMTLFSVMCVVLISCSGSSLTGTTGTNNTDNTNTTGVTAVNSVSDIPLSVVDPSAYDVSLTSSSVNDLMFAMPGEVGGFSRSGCEADQARNRIIREAKFPKMILCYMKAMSTSLGLEPGDGDYHYYNLGEIPGGPDEVGGTMDMKIAIKKSGTEFTMLMCESGVKTMEFVIDTGSAYSGHVIDQWEFNGYQDARHLTFEADGDPDNFTSATFSQTFSSAQWGYGQETLEASPSSATVYGYFNDTYQGQNFSGAQYAQFDATEGTAKYDVSGTYPAMSVGEIASFDSEWYNWLTMAQPDGLGLTDNDFICCDENGCSQVASGEGCTFSDSDTESYTISGSAPNQTFTVSASDSSYAAAVDAVTLPSTDTAPTISFSSTDFSDCTATTWSDMTTPTEAPDVSECMAMEDEMDDYQDTNGCQEQEDAALQAENY